jgi:N4-gp56 family major capsid protein
VANQTTSNTSNSVRVQYLADYVKGAMKRRVYDQLATPISADMAEVKKGSSVTVPFISSLAPSTQTISETADITPVNFTDTTATVTPTSRANAVIVSEKLLNTAYTDFNSRYYKELGDNMMESVDYLAMTAAVNGGLARSVAARASLDAGTATNRLAKTTFSNASIILAGMKVPMFETSRGGRWMAIIHPFAYADLMADSIMLAVGEYQAKDIVLNWELGELNGFKLIVSPWAKMFWGAGADNGTVVATTLAAATAPLATSITVASGSNIAAGQRLAIGTEETSTTLYETNESCIVKSISGTTVSVIGEGENGGLRFAHDSGVAVRNADNVAPCVFGGPESLAKVYDTAIGEYGELLEPERTGLAKQFVTTAWKWYGGYSILAENRIMRTEVSLGLDA